MGVLCWQPDGFWASTVYDVERAMEGWRRSNDVTGSDDDKPLTNEEIDRFVCMPDEIS